MTYGFIGTGTMGSALARALRKKVAGNDIFLANRSLEKAQNLAAEIGAIVSTNEEIAAHCDMIFLGVKPQMMPQVLQQLTKTLCNRDGHFVLISMAAGLTIDSLQKMLQGEYPIIRIMPNTPVAVGSGMILYACSNQVTTEQQEKLLCSLSQAGKFDLLPENLIDAGCALSGCGPAFVYLFLEALADGGVACGLPRQKALEYAAQTVAGAANLAIQQSQHPAILKDAVCSPGGSTIQGVRTLEEGAFRGTVMDAVIAAYQKTQALG